jgi:hypothetical protein
MHTCTSVKWKWTWNMLKWKSVWKLEFENVLNLWDKNVNNKLSPQYIIVKVLKCKYQKWIHTCNIWSFELKFMAKRKVMNQIHDLIFDH